MPTYEYVCEGCNLKFERRQAMTDAPLTECPECRGKVRRLVGAGAGFMLKGSSGRAGQGGRSCSLAQSGQTCCGLDGPCGKPRCG